MELLISVKKETFENVGEFVKTGKGSNLCQFVGQGVNLQQLSSLNSSISLPVLTSARVVEDKILIQAQKQSTLVSYSLLAMLLKSIEVENHVDIQKSSALVYIQIGGRKILTNYYIKSLKCLFQTGHLHIVNYIFPRCGACPMRNCFLRPGSWGQN